MRGGESSYGAFTRRARLLEKGLHLAVPTQGQISSIIWLVSRTEIKIIYTIMAAEQGINVGSPAKNALRSRAPSRESINNGVMEPSAGTKRGLKSRHAQLIALGGTIGTGIAILGR